MLEKCNWVSCVCSKGGPGTRPLSELVRFTSEENLKTWVSWIWRASEVGLEAPAHCQRHHPPLSVTQTPHTLPDQDIVPSPLICFRAVTVAQVFISYVSCSETTSITIFHVLDTNRPAHQDLHTYLPATNQHFFNFELCCSAGVCVVSESYYYYYYYIT